MNPRGDDLARRVRRLERANRAPLASVALALATPLVAARAPQQSAELVRAVRA